MAPPVTKPMIFVLARAKSVNFGQGDNGVELVLSDSYSVAQPAFGSAAGAAAHLDALPPHERHGMLVLPLEMRA